MKSFSVWDRLFKMKASPGLDRSVLPAPVNLAALPRSLKSVVSGHRAAFMSLCIFLFLVLPFLSGAGEMVDRVAAIVNDEMISFSEVLIAYHLQERQVREPDDEALKAVLDQLVNRELAYQEIRRFEQIQVTGGDVLGALEAYQQNLAPGDFEAVLAANGVSENEVEIIFAKKIILEKFCNERFMPFIQVSPGEIETYYNDIFIPELQERGETALPSLEAVSERIRLQLREEKFTGAVSEWIERLKQHAKIITILPSL